MITQRGIIEQNKAFHPMPLEKIEAVFAGLPWLVAFLENEKRHLHVTLSKCRFQIEQIFVSGIDSSFRSMYPLVCSKDGGSSSFDSNNVLHCPTLMDHFDTEMIYLVDKNGSVVTYEVVVPKFIKALFFWKKHNGTLVQEFRAVATSGDKLRNLLASIKRPAYYAVSYLDFTKTLIVYRPPRGLSINEWLEESKPTVQKEAQRELADELKVIDSAERP